MEAPKYAPKPKLTKSITVWIDDECAKGLDELKRQGYPHAAMVRDKLRELIREYLKAS